MIDNGNSATRQLVILAGLGWRWARGCFDTLVKDLSAVRSGKSAWSAMLLWSSAGFRVVSNRSGQISFKPKVLATAGEAGTYILKQLTAAERQALVLRIMPDRAILQEIALPRSAGPMLSAIVSNKIEGLSPWSQVDRLWGYALRPSGEGALSVHIGVVGRKALASHLEALSVLGIRPVRVEVAAGPDSAFPVVIEDNNGIRAARVGLIVKTIVGACAAALVGLGIVGVYLAMRDYAELTRIESRTEQLKRELNTGAGAAAVSSKVSDAIRHVDRKANERPFVDTLNALTEAIPDGSWLTSLDMARGILTVQGRGGPAPIVLQRIEQAGAFSSANFASATQHDEASAQDVFSISATVEPQAAAK